MSLNPTVNFVGKIAPPSAAYPYGEARNVTTSGDGTGTNFKADLVNDTFGVQQALLTRAGITPSGLPDTVEESQYMDALNSLYTSSKSTVAAMVADTHLNVGDRIVTYAYNSPVVSRWVVVSSGAGDLTDATLSLSNGLLAELQIEPMMSVRAFGAYGDDSNDDSGAWQNAVTNSNYIVGHPEDTYKIVTSVSILSNKRIDGRGCKCHWRGSTDALLYVNRDRGMFEFDGRIGAELDVSGNQAQWLEGAEQYATTDASLITPEKFVIMFGGSLPAPAVAYLVRPIPSLTSPTTRVQTDYRLGWTLTNVQWHYLQVTQVENSVIENMHVEDFTTFTYGDTSAGNRSASAIAMRVSVNCQVRNITSRNFQYPTVFGYYTTDCEVNNVFIHKSDRDSIGINGWGITVQWNNAYRCHSIRLNGQGVRRISDFTQAAHCTVRDCGGEATRDGEFTTHGSYEHDLHYENTRGIMTFASSGVAFGETSKNITIKKHHGKQLRTQRNVTNMSVHDCLVSELILNSVGLTVDNCSLYSYEGTTPFVQINNWSEQQGYPYTIERPTVISNSQLQSTGAVFLVDQNVQATEQINFTNCGISLRSGDFAGPANIKMTGCSLTGGFLVLVANPTRVELVDCNGVDVAFGVLADLTVNTGAVDFRIQGGSYTGTIASAFFSIRDYSAIGLDCKMYIQGTTVEWENTVIFDSPIGARNPLWDQRIQNSNVKNIGGGAGTVTFSTQQSPLHIGANTFEGCTLDLGTLGGARLKYNNVEI